MIAGYLSKTDTVVSHGDYDGWFMKLSAEPPLLQISAAGSGFDFAWPTSAPMFQLESNNDLLATGWSPVNLPITTNGGQNIISMPVDSTNHFFRLKQYAN